MIYNEVIKQFNDVDRFILQHTCSGCRASAQCGIKCPSEFNHGCGVANCLKCSYDWLNNDQNENDMTKYIRAELNTYDYDDKIVLLDYIIERSKTNDRTI